MVAIVALGLLLRARGYLFPGPGNAFWLDEASWAISLIDDPLKDLLIRPIGFMGITKVLVKIFGAREATFRLLAWLGGLITVLLLPALAKRLFRSAASRLLFVAVIVLAPSAIDLSKEFKPYALGIAVHAGMMFLALKYQELGTQRALLVVCGLIGVSVFFTQDAIFAYPGLFLFLGLEALQKKQMRHLAVLGITALLTLAVVGGMYVFIWSRLDQKEQAGYWGKKYDVFFVRKNNPLGKTDWFAKRYVGLAESPGERRVYWGDRVSEKPKLELTATDELVWAVLHFAGLTLLVRGRRLREGLLFFMPIAVMATFGLLGYWPFGAFRTNLFSLLYVTAIAGVAIDREAQKNHFADLAPAFALVLLPLFVFEEKWHQRKEAIDVTHSSSMVQAMRTLISLQGGGEPYPGPTELVIVDHYSCDTMKFYRQYHAGTKVHLGPEFDARFRESECMGDTRKMIRAVRHEVRNNEHAWFLISKPALAEKLESEWPDDLEKFALERIGGDEHLIIGVKKKSAGAQAVN
jgi:hypothetical protein